LLLLLEIDKLHYKSTEGINILRVISLISKLRDQLDVGAYPSDLWIVLQAPVHSPNRVFLWQYAGIDHKDILGVKFLTKSIDEPIVGGKLAALSVLDAKEKINI
jgi:hypothetical protein